MKQYRTFLLGVLVTVLASTLFWAGTAYASTGCFPDTNGYWAESFICWLKEHGITAGYADGTFKPNNAISRGEMAVMLQRAANVPPTTGEIRVNTGANGWDIYGIQPQPLTIFQDYGYIGFSSPNPNTIYGFLMTPSFPSALYGRNMSVSGMEYCYATTSNTYIDWVQAFYSNVTSSAFPTSNNTLVFDDTNRTDAACRYYSFTPTAMDDNTVLSVFVGGAWGPSGAGAWISLGRVTFFLQPTDTPVPAP